MKKIFILAMLIQNLVFAAEGSAYDNKVELTTEQKAEQQRRTEEAIKQALKDEEKFAREQKFYDMNTYDFKGSEVKEESLESINPVPVENFDMNHVYD